MKTLGELYNYTNDILLQGELDSIADVIHFYEECQQMISMKDKLEATQTYTLTSNVIAVPSDYLGYQKIKISGCSGVSDGEYSPTEMWGKQIEMPEEIQDGTLKLYYYKNPTELDKNNLNQVPDIDYRYLNSMAVYAAEMYYRNDDDPEMRNAFKESFFLGLSYFSSLNGSGTNQPTKIKNVW